MIERTWQACFLNCNPKPCPVACKALLQGPDPMLSFGFDAGGDGEGREPICGAGFERPRYKCSERIPGDQATHVFLKK